MYVNYRSFFPSSLIIKFTDNMELQYSTKVCDEFHFNLLHSILLHKCLFGLKF